MGNDSLFIMPDDRSVIRRVTGRLVYMDKCTRNAAGETIDPVWSVYAEHYEQIVYDNGDVERFEIGEDGERTGPTCSSLRDDDDEDSEMEEDGEDTDG
jgi:hypothetical protein